MKRKADQQSEKRWDFYEKSWLKKIVIFTKLPSKTVVLCSKSPPTHILKHTVKTMIFQQYFPNNSSLNRMTKHLFFLFGH